MGVSTKTSWSRLGGVLSHLAKDIPKPGPDDDELPWMTLQWELAVGKDLAQVTRLDRATSKTLYVEVDGKPWITPLKALESQLLKSLNDNGLNRFTRILYHETSATKSWKRTPHSSPGTTPKSINRSSINRGASDTKGLSMIEDTQLRDTLARISRHLQSGAGLIAMTLLLANCAALEVQQPTDQGTVKAKSFKTNASAHSSPQSMKSLDQSLAVKTIKKLKGKNPDADLNDPRAYYHYLIGLKRMNEGDFDAATKHFTELVRHAPDREDFSRRLVRLYVRTGQLDAAEKHARRALERFPKNVPLRMVLADVLSVHNQNQEALDQYGKIFDNNPKNGRSKLMMGDLFEKMKRPKEAIEAYRSMTVADSHNPLGFFFLGRALLNDGQYEKAELELKRALALRPSLFEARKYLARAMEKQHHYDDALKEYETLKKLIPDKELEAHLAKIEEIQRSSDPSNAPSLPPLEINQVPVHALLGAVYYEQAAYLESLDEFRLVLETQNDLEIRLLVSKIYEIFGRVDKAILEIERYRENTSDPERIDVLLNLARLYGINKQMDKSVTLLQAALRHEPKNDRLYHSLALAHMALSDYDKAILTIQKAIDLDQKRDAYFFELGALYERKGNFQRAVEAMEKVIALNPNHSNAHNFIGYLYAMQGAHLDQAVGHLEKALSIQPRNGYFLDSLGWIYYKKGELDLALTQIKKAMIYVSPDPVLYDHLGDVLFSMKNFPEAHSAWKTSLALTMKKLDDPTGEVPDPSKLKEKIRQALEKMNTRTQ